MTAKGIVKGIYKTIRSVIFTVTLLVVGLYVLIYAFFSIPYFTNQFKNILSSELSILLGGKVEINDLDVYPFNEVMISGLKIYDPEGVPCLEVETIGAGIRLWKLITEQKFEFTYGEIIGLNAYLVQKEKDGPLNIKFLIDALSSKEKKEKKPFELALRNVVLRKSNLSFVRPWLQDAKIGSLDLADIKVSDLAADVSFPRISDKGIDVDLRRLSLSLTDAIDIEKIGLSGVFSAEKIEIQNFILEFPNSRIHIPKVYLHPNKTGQFKQLLEEEMQHLSITQSFITPSDFSFLSPIMKEFDQPLNIDLMLDGNLNELTVKDFNFGNPEVATLSFKGKVVNLSDIKSLSANLSTFNLYVTANVFRKLNLVLPKAPGTAKNVLQNIGDLKITGEFATDLSKQSFEGNVDVTSDLAKITFEGGVFKTNSKNMEGQGELNIEDLRLHKILPSSPVNNINANIIADASLNNGQPNGILNFVVEDFELRGKKYDGFSLNITKENERVEGDLFMHNAIADIESSFAGDIEGPEKSARVDMDLQRVNLSEVIDMKKYKDYILSGSINIDGAARGLNDLTGEFIANNFSFVSPDQSKKLRLKQLKLNAGVSDSIQSINLISDWVDFRAEGPFKLSEIPLQLKALAADIFPALIPYNDLERIYSSDLDFDVVIKKNNAVPEFFSLPFRFLVPVTISGSIQGSTNSANLTFDLPYLQQGKDKLIYDTKLVAEVNGEEGVFNAMIQTNVPVKRGDLALNIDLFGRHNNLSTNLRWVNTENTDFKAHLMLDTEFSKNPFTNNPEIKLQILPSVLQMGTADWNVAKCDITYADKTINVNNLRVWHDDQFVEITGTASPEFDDSVRISLADIDVDYVFDLLQINYVTFGGVATGEITGRALLSGNPVAETESLIIKNFSYNGAFIGICEAASRWNNEEKEIEISADITHEGRKRVEASGGIWLGRDSLSFNIGARKVPVDFVQPFMSVFSSHVGGFATGDVTLFGTFKDIDMTGKIFADSVAIKLDYTNTIYHGSDSVILNPGQIEIPNFRLYDKFGNSALLTGELTHRYFHDPSFTFRLSDANDFLCYDTNSDLNPDWYGTLFGTGSAVLTGTPGITDISADMTVSGNSNFTFVLSDTQYARDYQFLTFSDRRAEELKKNQEPTTQDIKAMLRKSMYQDGAGLSIFGIDIRATVTPQVLFTLVMDPRAGDKITARGRGAMQVKYESDDDEMMMYGKYEIVEGNYNFSLQDIILRDFKIKEGSSISFNGNPLAADLDISATYRVNTNLSDLDKSFSTDRDLNRTNVPVDAVLSVKGNMTSPDITFDIELPTLTQDVERKVKSIISTDDMMNRQMIYLLALNRFYTPEYMGASGNGGELAGLASSTISSQLSNILGQLTDKFSVSPSFRSDKGDFSDIEVDVALSSRLLNNRLLINGNFGYRDRSTSTTTFVGDFDVEYLLSKNGNLRLKAYNHFNDQNYYLREALTTQGLGVVYRKDFDDLFRFLRPKKKASKEGESSEIDVKP